MQAQFNHVILVGPMGAGKSTVGERLAVVEGIDFWDTDQEIIQRTGQTIQSLFDKSEAVFRQIESKVLEQLLRQPPAVIATGGGIVLSAQNQKLLLGKKRVIYLSATPQTIACRLEGETTRPLLNYPARAHRIQSLVQAREPLYRRVAEWRLPTDSLTPVEVTEALQNYLHERSE